MDFSIRTATPAEQMYSYSQSSQIEGQTGCIGHLRADFGSDGNSFYSSWADHNTSLKDQAFKDEFDHLINTLRGLEAPDASQTQHEAILRDRAVLTSYCYRHPDSKRPGFYGRELTLRADTQKHAYILRLNPQKGDYNLYCYCYRKDWLDRHLKNAEKGIRFIDPNYKELFRIEDGDKVRYSTRSGETRQMTCRYIDDYHFEANSYRGNNLYHICEFAELYQNHGCHGIIPLRQSLPESCFSTLETTGELIVITKGEKGYSPTGVFPQDTSPKRRRSCSECCQWCDQSAGSGNGGWFHVRLGYACCKPQELRCPRAANQKPTAFPRCGTIERKHNGYHASEVSPW